MGSPSRKPIWMTVLVVTVVAVAIFGSMLFSQAKTNTAAAQCSGMQHGTQSDQSHAKMCGDGCSMSKNCANVDGHVMLNGKVASVGRDGTITIRLKPADNAPEAARTAIKELKAGDSISLMMMLGKAKSAGTTEQAAKYTCPMHPEVTSDKPGQCPKCGMNLQQVNSKN